MASITELIKQLRASTQAGFMDCKKALEATNNDIDQAIKWLRENGIAKAAKKVDNVASEGVIKLKLADQKATVLEINSQTDFVTKNDQFIAFSNELIDLIHETGITDVAEIEKLKLASGSTVAETQIHLTAIIGEKISLRRVQIIKEQSNSSLGIYLHSNNRIGVIIETSKTDDKEFLKHVAMHIAASNPKFLSKDDVAADFIEKEKEIAKSQALAEGKPANFIEKIVEGRIQKILEEVCLVNQKFLINQEQTVLEAAKAKNIQLLSFVRFEVGEGIEKAASNFADEVKAQMK
ncbi:translation elongation factor Ts [Mycoplasma bradburyae]|uniref:Elongation factor Ts n=1 Tax=Mycoplasma bradburyae TaxID=2963128 RepID=A0ABT5GBE5_9MOLU|nr:translation elongation factor Ts [Mycoplasma bradburyae]MDC4163131.1 translation elongation factor Ts [Mycoplasma bradburyae]MDC4181740.1 translation elongation factor Ts [Mycoplasma bradburyae]MDC4183913.1 translation elongation factor Ts [Mycoplasma bradburyae]UTS70215.1 translation elongation factor Ts [Mycoplasma bradburyae]UTS70939.1 translation elongation factor Ts [Mycoplasma bradburyae]